jgi:lipopolysaccharide transport system ATP-binding protein
MPDVVIEASKLGKSYIIGHQAENGRYVALRDVLMHNARNIWNTTKDLARGKPIVQGDVLEEVWALKDVSFEIQRGEAVGVIGRNGAGKSTLLKVLSRITEPSAGRVTIKGRVASLLEVGTGFHPELTGRENIYLNGAILGMTRAEIKRKFDEIVAFAEVDKFLDTPVKRYSSGMYVRLAFAVAAHLEPEILVVDEVLAVGDAAFQKKCLGKMGDVAKGGRTVLFVSHNMGAVSQLCSRVMLFTKGEKVFEGDSNSAISAYLESVSGSEASASFKIEQGRDVQILSMKAQSSEPTGSDSIGFHPHTLPLDVVIRYTTSKWPVRSYVCLDVFTASDIRLLWTSDVSNMDDMLIEREPGLYEARIRIPGNILAPGRYYFTAAVYSPTNRLLYDVRDKAISVEIADGGSFLASLGIAPHSATMIPLSWETKKLQSAPSTPV